jgi:hypothetical protein
MSEGFSERRSSEDNASIQETLMTDALVRTDTASWMAHARVEKWNGDQVAEVVRATGVENPSADLLSAHVAPYEVVEEPGNLLTTAGLTRLMSLLNGAGGQALTNTATRIGVGNSSTAATIADTDLGASAGSTNRFFMTMDATYPSVASNVLTAKATFGSSDGNFVWNEWALDIGTPTVTSGTTVGTTFFNHKIASLGTKVSPAVWGFTVTVTIS